MLARSLLLLFLRFLRWVEVGVTKTTLKTGRNPVFDNLGNLTEQARTTKDLWRSQWDNRQPSNGLKFNRQPSRMQIDVSRQKALRYSKFHYFSWSSRTLAPEESLLKLEKSVSMFSKTYSLDVTRPYNFLKSENIWKGQDNIQHTKVNFDLYRNQYLL